MCYRRGGGTTRECCGVLFTREGHETPVFVQADDVGDGVAVGLPAAVGGDLAHQALGPEDIGLHHGSPPTRLTEKVHL